MKNSYGIRLYRAHDLDLISLMEDYNFNFVKAVYCSLTAFCNQQTFVVKDMEKRETPKKFQKKSILRVLTLDSEKDQKAIQFLNSIQKGYRNNFLKNLLRLYLCRPMADLYFSDPEDAKEADKMCEIFSDHRKGAKAANFSKASRSESESLLAELGSDEKKKKVTTKRNQKECAKESVEKTEKLQERVDKKPDHQKMEPVKEESKTVREQNDVHVYPEEPDTSDGHVLSEEEQNSLVDAFLGML